MLTAIRTVENIFKTFKSKKPQRHQHRSPTPPPTTSSRASLIFYTDDDDTDNDDSSSSSIASTSTAFTTVSSLDSTAPPSIDVAQDALVLLDTQPMPTPRKRATSNPIDIPTVFTNSGDFNDCDLIRIRRDQHEHYQWSRRHRFPVAISPTITHAEIGSEFYSHLQHK